MSTNISPLLIDSLKLPRFNTLDEFAKLTGLSTQLLYCLSLETSNYYKHTTIPKRNGSLREISIPSYTLHILQRWILTFILEKILPSNRAMAFRRGSQFGNKQNAFYHAHTLYGLSIDLRDFFPSITSNKVYTVFSNIGYNNFAATILTNICTLDGRLPQGSACSPAISNIVCISLDNRLIGLCEKRGVRITRYADDMYFSCDDKTLLLKIFPVIKKIIEDEGFAINEKKVHFHTPSNKKIITGVTVATTTKEDVIELKAPKALKRKIRAEIFKCIVSGEYKNKSHILGEISYVDFVEKENVVRYLPNIKKYVSNTAMKISVFPELVEAYNSNLLFTDLDCLESQKIEIDDDDDFAYYSNVFEERKTYLQRNNIEDICQYSGWPLLLLNEDELCDADDDPF
jgi:RNA-directed DNA polymerase